ncbi:transcriptional regulator, RpiR family [Kandleria vitulina]|jgi:DNA-binding MurR/RpiR family transcriptional regulator|uniref:RpiR family transcriptional regulator n=2 Tax=Kandleria vitulina TaxID=1630 RepID=A0A0R2HE56_9FIRM|nr:MurR/RpiR family transcriptional regulator [Kandleria vitulina]KRN51337.1 RpiR family transcriptional regulator [Kandleria vitulina DSM 20405]MEE0988563.1 MurR/RpiR family transcriptional regulator [Kandleria vitulina]SDL57245.1 transcriptional regulator, RpiR family [Kandleria vitulina]SDV99845.1 transcriptional regulator, RpiR family [Kandleria vitulina]SEJ04706.1 transcriptional regulator, RpiR family [Kandleria vitulina]
MNEAQTVMDRISIIYDQLFDAEKKIAKYILNNHKLVVDMTVSELAKASDVSVASVSRFCRKVGLKGFHQLKIGLAKEMVETYGEGSISNDISLDNIGQSLQNILANKIEELKQTVNQIDIETFHVILKTLEKARHVQIVAVGNTIPVAIDAAFKFNELGIPTTAGTIWETQLSYCFTLGEGDVLIAISNSGESDKVYEAVKIAKENGATTIGITNNSHSAIGESVDYHITTATREKLFLDEFCFSRVSATTVIEIIFLFLTTSIENSHSKIAKCEDIFAFDKR